MKNECRVKLYHATLLSILLAAVFAISGCANPEKAKIAHVEKGEVYLKDEKFQEASLEFRNAIQIDEKLASAHWGLARAYEGLQRFQEAFEELRKTTELDPDHLDSRVKLGNYYIAAARNNPQLIAEAERLAKAILQKDSNHVEGHILMGSILYAQNQREQAFAEINHAISLDPKRVESYLSLARFYIVTNDNAKAEETFQRAISVNDNSGLAHTEYGKYLVQQNRQAEAEAADGQGRRGGSYQPHFAVCARQLLSRQQANGQGGTRLQSPGRSRQGQAGKPGCVGGLLFFSQSPGRSDQHLSEHPGNVA